MGKVTCCRHTGATVTSDIKILTYMVPSEVGDGHGFRSIVSPEPGIHLLVSEVHHGKGHTRVDETLVFACDESGRSPAGPSSMVAA